MTRHVKIWGRRLGLVLIVGVLLVAASLSTTTGQRVALTTALSLASSEDQTIAFERLTGSLFSTGEIGRFTLSDKDGVWLEARDIAFAWSPWSLVSKKIDVDHVRVASVTMHRHPLADNATSRKAGADAGGLPGIALVARDFRIARVHLAEAVAGLSADFRVRASANMVSVVRGLEANVDIARIDGADGKLVGTLQYVPDRQALKISVSASEAENGVVASLLQLPGKPPLALHFKGDGTLANWRGGWTASASEQPFAKGDIAIETADADRYRVTSSYSGYVEALVPRQLVPVFAGQTKGNLTILASQDGAIELHNAVWRSDAVSLSMKGRLSLPEVAGVATVNARVERANQQPVVFADETGALVSVQSANAAVQISEGPSGQPLRFTFDANGVTASETNVSRIVSKGRGVVKHDGKGKLATLHDLDVKAVASAVTSQHQDIESIIGPEVRAHLQGNLAQNLIELSRLQIITSSAELVGQGAYNEGRGSGEVSLTANELAHFKSLLGTPLQGSGQVTANIDASLAPLSIDIKFNGALKDVQVSEKSPFGVLAGNTTLAGSIRHQDENVWHIDQLVAENAQLKMQAEGIHTPDKTDLSASVSIPSLTALNDELSGGIEVTAKAQGSSDNLKTSLRARSDGLHAAGETLKEFTLDIRGAGTITKQTGRITFASQWRTDHVRGESDFSISESGAFELRDIAFNSPFARAEGWLLNTPENGFRTDTTVVVDDLKPLSVLAGRPMAGKIEAAMRLTDEMSTASLLLKGRGISIDGFRLQMLDATGKGQDDGRIVFNATATSDGRKLETAGTFAQSSETGARIVAISNLVMNGYGIVAKLTKPTEVKTNGADVVLSPAEFRLGGGQVVLSGALRKNTLDFTAKLQNVPARLAKSFEPNADVQGDINGSIAIKGTADRPDVEANVAWTGARYAPLTAKGFPAISVNTKSRFVNKRVQTEIAITGPQSLNVKASGVIEPSDNGKIDMKVVGNVPLSLANPVLAQQNARASGSASINGSILGRIEKPVARIVASLTDASFTDGSSGISLSSIRGDITATERTLVASNVTGVSREGGTVTMNGALPYEYGADAQGLRITLDDFKFNDRQIVSGQVDGDIALTGALTQLSAAGTVAIKRMDVFVPNQMPKSIVDLDIKHLNAPKGREDLVTSSIEQQPGASSSAQGIPLNLQLTAADRIFVKGRGLDTQLGGRLQLRGDSATPRADGGFSMVRGRLSILGRQLDFKRGRISFFGSLEPTLDMEASAVADGTTITVLVTGPASKPRFKFSSVPSLPEDEVVAKLLFNKSLAKLSPLQVAQLAGEIDKIGGLSSGPGTLDQLKSSLGVDVLDVATDDKGKASVSAGSYLNEKTYVGVQQGTDARSNRVIVDHELTNAIKARGELGSDGDSKLGVGVEWDY